MSETEDGGSQPEVGTATSPAGLAPRWEEVAGELARTDSHLAALFRTAHALLQRLDGAGVLYLVAHCGRGVAAAVVRALTQELPELRTASRPR
jgi:hypothetical protein